MLSKNTVARLFQQGDNPPFREALFGVCGDVGVITYLRGSRFAMPLELLQHASEVSQPYYGESDAKKGPFLLCSTPSASEKISLHMLTVLPGFRLKEATASATFCTFYTLCFTSLHTFSWKWQHFSSCRSSKAAA